MYVDTGVVMGKAFGLLRVYRWIGRVREVVDGVSRGKNIGHSKGSLFIKKRGELDTVTGFRVD